MSRSLICADPAAVGGERRAAAPSMLRPDDPAAVGVVDIVIGEEIGRFRAGVQDLWPLHLLNGVETLCPVLTTKHRAFRTFGGKKTTKAVETITTFLAR